MNQTTLCLLIKDKEVLLAMKKRGFGAGRWNGAGGKFDSSKGDKNIIDAAIRETKEEIGVEIKNPEQAAIFNFHFPNKPEWDQEVSLFVARDWDGDPQESEEMAPKWFEFEKIPYEKMWPDDIHWMPHILQGKKLKASFSFGEGDKILHYDLKLVKEI